MSDERKGPTAPDKLPNAEQARLRSLLWQVLERRIDRLALAIVAVSATIASISETVVLVVISLGALRLSGDSAVPVELPFGLPVDELGTAQLVGLGILALVIRITILVINKFLSAHLSASTMYRWRRRFFLAFQNAPWETQAAHDDGYLQTLTQTYAGRVSAMIRYVAVAVTSGISFATFALGALLISPLGALGLVGFGLILFVLLRPLTKAVERTSTVQKQASKEFARQLGEAADMTLEHRVLGSTLAVERGLNEQLMTQARVSRRQVTLQGLSAPIYTGLGYLAILVGLAVATQLEVSEIASLGAIVLMMLRSIGYGQLFQSTTQNIAAARPFAAELIQAVEELESSRQPNGQIIQAEFESIELRDTSLGYGGEAVVSNINLTIRSGESIGIIGPSGGGKSTLALTLLGLLPPVGGEFLINGEPSSEYSLDWWQRHVSFVPQQAALFDGTAAENIAIHRSQISQSEIRQAAVDAHLEDEIRTWPGGLSHRLGPRGNRISGGQRQRICIARALAGKPSVLILDEPTSALDVVSEGSITEVLRDLRHTCTMIVVAHRLSTLEFCDRVFLVDRGSVREVGSGSDIQDFAAFFPDEDPPNEDDASVSDEKPVALNE